MAATPAVPDQCRLIWSDPADQALDEIASLWLRQNVERHAQRERSCRQPTPRWRLPDRRLQTRRTRERHPTRRVDESEAELASPSPWASSLLAPFSALHDQARAPSAARNRPGWPTSQFATLGERVAASRARPRREMIDVDLLPFARPSVTASRARPRG